MAEVVEVVAAVEEVVAVEEAVAVEEEALLEDPPQQQLEKITGQVTCTGKQYGLPGVRVWVENFPPARNPHLWVRV